MQILVEACTKQQNILFLVYLSVLSVQCAHFNVQCLYVYSVNIWCTFNMVCVHACTLCILSAHCVHTVCTLRSRRVIWCRYVLLNQAECKPRAKWSCTVPVCHGVCLAMPACLPCRSPVPGKVSCGRKGSMWTKPVWFSRHVITGTQNLHPVEIALNQCTLASLQYHCQGKFGLMGGPLVSWMAGGRGLNFRWSGWFTSWITTAFRGEVPPRDTETCVTAFSRIPNQRQASPAQRPPPPAGHGSCEHSLPVSRLVLTSKSGREEFKGLSHLCAQVCTKNQYFHTTNHIMHNRCIFYTLCIVYTLCSLHTHNTLYTLCAHCDSLCILWTLDV